MSSALYEKIKGQKVNIYPVFIISFYMDQAMQLFGVRTIIKN